MKRLQRPTLSILSLVLALAAVELWLRIRDPMDGHRIATELEHFRLGGEEVSRLFIIDPEMGCRPRLGEGRLYSEWGTRPNSYQLAPDPETTRVLFVGDSVTARGFIVDGIRQAYDEEGLEYWNAGVESFNTIQELEFFCRYNHRCVKEILESAGIRSFDLRPLVGDALAEGMEIRQETDDPWHPSEAFGRLAAGEWLQEKRLLEDCQTGFPGRS